MKLKENYVLRQVAKSWVVLPLREATLNLNGMVTLNDSGAMLWKLLEQGCDEIGLAEALMAEYEVTKERAVADVDAFLDVLFRAGCVE